MRFIDRSSAGSMPVARITLALTALVGLWPACSSKHESDGPSLLSGSGGGSGALGRGGTAGGSLCAPPGPCGGSNHGPDLVLVSGGAANGGPGGASGASGANALCQPPALVAPGCMPASADGSEPQCNGLDDDCD